MTSGNKLISSRSIVLNHDLCRRNSRWDEPRAVLPVDQRKTTHTHTHAFAGACHRKPPWPDNTRKKYPQRRKHTGISLLAPNFCSQIMWQTHCCSTFFCFDILKLKQTFIDLQGSVVIVFSCDFSPIQMFPVHLEAYTVTFYCFSKVKLLLLIQYKLNLALENNTSL